MVFYFINKGRFDDEIVFNILRAKQRITAGEIVYYLNRND
jgi:hypothetical protein